MKEKNRNLFVPMTIRSNEHLASAIKRIRKLHKLSQIELSKKTGLTQATISRIENANKKVEIRTLFLILAALGVDIQITPRPKLEVKSVEGLF